MSVPLHLSKSRFCVGLQCLRRLWWQVHEPDAPELVADDRQQAIFDRGHQVGELARARFPGGTFIDLEPWQVADRIAATRTALGDGAPAVFEAGFAAGGVFAALDVLERRRSRDRPTSRRRSGSGWRSCSACTARGALGTQDSARAHPPFRSPTPGGRSTTARASFREAPWTTSSTRRSSTSAR